MEKATDIDPTPIGWETDGLPNDPVTDAYRCAKEEADHFIEWVWTHPGDPGTPDQFRRLIERTANCAIDPDQIAVCQNKATSAADWLTPHQDFSSQELWVSVTLPGAWYEGPDEPTPANLMWKYTLEFNKIDNSEC